MKTKLNLRIVVSLFLGVFLLAIPTITEAEEPLVKWQPERAFFKMHGSYVVDDSGQPPYDTWGDRCSFRGTGRKRSKGWSGRGRWIDNDWEDGALVARLRITDGELAHDPNYGHIPEIFQLSGKARVRIGGSYIGEFGFRLHMADADGTIYPDQPDWVGFILTDENGEPWYQTGNPKVTSGDVATYWYPEFE